MSKTAVAVYLNQEPYGYRSGETAEIVGVRMAKPQGLDWRPCFVLRFADGEEDLVPIYDPPRMPTIVPSCSLNRED